MKYHDSIEKSGEIMALSVAQLKQWCLPVDPINYAVSYEYCKKSKPRLVTSIAQQLLLGKGIDGFFMEELYKEHVLEQSKFRDEIISDLSVLLSDVQSSCVKSSSSAQELIKQLDTTIPALLSLDRDKVKIAAAKLQKASTTFKQQQQQLTEQLKASQLQTQALEAELEDVRKEIYLDPVTGLYNRKAMSKHIDSWLEADSDRAIAAIVVSVDYFEQFSQRFGSLIGGVILSKIAKKIRSYVDSSGLPVRSGHDEFVLLIPDVDGSIAVEIAEKIKQGVEKLRFVSIQSGVRLPKMSVSLGIGEMRAKEPLNQFINRTRKAVIDDSKHTN
ncbi:MAG: diguanylate cyclase [Colwellia sp.]